MLSRMPQPGRRLSDKILDAFDQACARRELEVAELLVKALETTLTRAGGKGHVDQRREFGPVVEAYARLKRLRGGLSLVKPSPGNRNSH
jgi:predicted alpha/beta hydrolase family esterase